MKNNSSNTLLHLCARATMQSELRQQLLIACRDTSNWDEMLQVAEYHGLAPLMHKHLSAVADDAEIPQDIIRGLRFLSVRHKQANTLLTESLGQILSILESEGIPCLVLKGAALSNIVYPDISLRPMRDIDLLLGEEDAHRAYDLLKKDNFYESAEVLPEGYYHLPPLFKDVDGLKVCVELHHGIFPDDPPYYQQLGLDDLYNGRQRFEVNGVGAYTLANEEMLWHLYQHGFHAPLTYEPFRLLAVADIISLVEARTDEIDWEKVQRVYPQLHNGLSLLHHITPWSESVLNRHIFGVQEDPSGVGECYEGWPRIRLQKNTDATGQSIWNYLVRTFYPSQWWSMLYYGHKGSLLDSIRCRLISHPKHLLRWLKVYMAKRFGVKKRVER